MDLVRARLAGTTPSQFKGDETHIPNFSGRTMSFSGTQAWVMFSNPLAMEEPFSVELRFGDYDGGTATVAGLAKPVPEPSTMLLFGSGLAGLADWCYRKNVKV